MREKYFVLLPDGIGLRNFAYTSFHDIAKASEVELVFWNSTPFDLEAMGYAELKAPVPKLHKLTEVFKNVRKNIELYFNVKKTQDTVYYSYKFPRKWGSINVMVKNLLTSFYTSLYRSEAGLARVREKIVKLEKSTEYYEACLQVLKEEKPAVIFCTNQRSSSAIAPIEAAKSLGIPTVSFIFSWDNLPKATTVVEADYYFVWSAYMKKELLFYYPDVNEGQVIVTGTPQFEGHFNKEHLLSKETFFRQYDLDVDKKYICFSGDDITTSPNDPYYMEDTAEAVRHLNQKGYNIGIIFRRCPVDFSDRYDSVLKEYKDIIVPIAPIWEEAGSMWNAIMPTLADTELLINTATHADLVINVGSSMVFDFVCHDKPCAFINYNTENRNHTTWNIEHIYRYVHFRSMPNKEAVLWLNYKESIVGIIEKALTQDNLDTIKSAKDWFDIIVEHPRFASDHIWKELGKIIDKKK